MQNSVFVKGATSFVDKLKEVPQKDIAASKNTTAGVEDDISDDSMSDTDDSPKCEIVEDPSRNFPNFIFSSKMKRRMYKAWHNSVIIKLLGRNIGFKALETRIQSLWAKRGVIKLINIGNGYRVVKLSNKED